MKRIIRRPAVLIFKDLDYSPSIISEISGILVNEARDNRMYFLSDCISLMGNNPYWDEKDRGNYIYSWRMNRLSDGSIDFCDRHDDLISIIRIDCSNILDDELTLFDFI